MYIPFKIGEKEFLVQPYTTSQEKEILLLSNFDVQELDRVFEVLNLKSDFSISDLSEDEKKVLLYKFRDISLGDVTEIKFTCGSCKQAQETNIELNGFLIDCKRNDSDIKKINKTVTDDNLQDFLLEEIDVDSLDIEEFEELKQKIQDNQVHFNFIREVKCLKCGATKKLNLGDPAYIIESMSDDTLMTLYKTINYMVFFSNYTKNDIDKMLPFERSILGSLLKKTKEDLTT